MKKQTIVTADDHPLLLKGLNDFLVEKGYIILGSANNGNSAYNLIATKKPDIAIIDIQMPQLSGLEVAKLCKKYQLPVKIILLTFHKEASLYFEATSLNVFGYVLKEFAMEEMENCLRTVANGNVYFSPNIKDSIEMHEPKNVLQQLTPSERKILKQIADEKTNKEIADSLFISPRTVEKHRSNIIQKLNLEPKTNALLLWVKENQDLWEF